MINQLKTIILLAVLTALTLWIGNVFGGTSGLIIAGAIALVINFGSYFFSDKLVLMMYHAKEVTEKDEPVLYKMVHEVATLAELPMPKVYTIPSASPNAFATGRNPNHSAVAFTEGILGLLNKDELKGVIAHEMSHIKNRDILISTIAATFAGIISYLATMAQWAAIFGSAGRDNNNGLGNIAGLLVIAILTPIIATVIQLAISRTREYHADASAAAILKNSHGLASALEKLKTGIPRNPLKFGSEQTANMFIADPFSVKGLFSLFQTHPPIDERIKRLKEMHL